MGARPGVSSFRFDFSEFLQRGRHLGRADISCKECATYLSKGMDYRIAKSRNFIRQAKRIEKKVQLLCKYSVAIKNLM